MIQPFFAADNVLLFETALLGEIWELPEALFQRRMHPGISTMANKSWRALHSWFDPSKRGIQTFIPPTFRIVLHFSVRRRGCRCQCEDRWFCYSTVIRVWSPRESRRLFEKVRIHIAAGEGSRRFLAEYLRRHGSPGLEMRGTVILYTRKDMGSKLRVGDWVQVRSKDEILATLTKDGQLDGLPFMPQMFQYCGKRFKVFKRAHKTCDTVFPVRGRRMASAVHLETRCTGLEFGGCQAGCLLFWKEAWLKKVDDPGRTTNSPVTLQSHAGCTAEDVWAAIHAPGQKNDPDPAYVCQATRLPYATTRLEWWDFRQYIEDFTSGNASLRQIIKGAIYSSYYRLSISVVGLGPIMRWLYDKSHPLWGERFSPDMRGSSPLTSRRPHRRQIWICSRAISCGSNHMRKFLEH